MAGKFDLERSLVEVLLRRRGMAAERYIDPNASGDETGADVIAIIDGRWIGIQVTRLDTGEVAGKARREEIKAWRDSQAEGRSTYGGFAQNDVEKVLDAIKRAVASKRQQVVGCDESWLLISANVPEEKPALISTFVMSPWLSPESLDRVTSDLLAKTNYKHAFLHCIVGDENALYCRATEGTWKKSVTPKRNDGPSFWDIQKHMR